MSAYGFGTTLPIGPDEAGRRVRDALKAEGFGVLTEIDVQRTLRDKLGVETEPYLILGACNPSLAHRALTAAPEIGLLLPCNVVIRAVGEGSRVEIVDPAAMLGIAGEASLGEVAAEARAKLERALAALGESESSQARIAPVQGGQ
jgi:uncharacterized protein (DUF302 family)